jgi:tetratricopeptide (TPR) repeat protein
MKMSKRPEANRVLSVLTVLAVLFLKPSGTLAATEIVTPGEAQADYKKEDFKKAIKECSIYLEHHPGDAEALRLRGKSYLGLGDFNRAAADLESAAPLPGPLEAAMENQAKLKPNDDDAANYPEWLQALVLLYVARLNAEQGQYERAVKFCDCALAKNPVFPECQSLRANLLMLENLLYESEGEYRLAVSLRPRDWHMWLGYATVLQKQVKYAQALDAIERAITLIKSPPYQEANLDKRLELMNKTRDFLRERTTFHKN